MPPDIAPEYLREKAAAEYLMATYGHGTASTFMTLRSTGGGPEFHKVGRRFVVYTRDALDRWALAKISRPYRSTAELSAANSEAA